MIFRMITNYLHDLQNKIRRQQTNALGTNKLLDNLTLIVVNFEHGIACWVEYMIHLV